MQYTLLELVQLILSSMDGDEVDTILETTESEQIANVIKSTYWDIISRADFPEIYTFFRLTQTSAATPTMMTLPSTLSLEFVKYNGILEDSEGDTSDLFQDVEWMALEKFLSRMYSLSTDDSDVTGYTATIDGATQSFFAINTRPPQYYTTFNDQTVIFDAFNSDEEDFLEAEKTMCYGKKLPTFSMSDSFVPDLPDQFFSLLLNESKALAFAELKQVTHAKAEQRARRGWINLQKRDRKLNESNRPLNNLPNYGRK